MYQIMDMPVQKPVIPPASEKRGTIERLTPIALSRPWTGIGRHAVPPLVAGVAHPLRRAVERAGGLETGDQAVGLFSHGGSGICRQCGSACGRDGLDLRHRHQRQEADEEQEQDREDAEGSEEGEDVDDGRAEITPARGQEVAGKRRADDDEALEPHADVDEERKHPDERRVLGGRALNQKNCGVTTLHVIMIQ